MSAPKRRRGRNAYSPGDYVASLYAPEIDAPATSPPTWTAPQALRNEVLLRAVENRWEPCSGQSTSSRHWGLYNPYGEPWQRARDKRGRLRLFGSYETARRAADRLNTRNTTRR